MADTQRSFVVFRDEDDNYFAVPREVIDHHRVRREWKAKLRQVLDGDEDVEGFAMVAGGISGTSVDSSGGGSTLQLVGTMTISAGDLFEAATLR